MNRIFCRSGLFIFLIISAAPAFSMDQAKALDEIAAFAERVCQTASIKSQSAELKLSGRANAELKGLLSKVAALGFAGATEYKKTESEGVLQKDLAALLSKSVDCRQDISNRLIDKLIATPRISSVKTSANKKINEQQINVGDINGGTTTITQQQGRNQ